MRNIATLIALVAMVSVASAATGSITYLYDTVIPNVTNGSQGAANEWTVNQLSLDTTVDWVSSELIVTPGTTGQIYQYFYLDNRGNRIDNAASAMTGDISFDGDAATYDTFISDGLLLDGTTESGFSWLAPSGYSLVYTGTAAEDTLSVIYYHVQTNNIGDLDLAQVTINENYTGGTWSFKAFDAGSASVAAYEVSGTIVNGALVPEPATMLVMAIGGIGVLARRRRK